MRLKIGTSLKAILSAAGVAALLASPAVAKTVRHQGVTPPTVYVPGNPHGFVDPYTPRAPRHRDFQDSPGRMG